MKVKRIAAGSYEVHTNHGVYSVQNCPAENPRESGLPSGPRWMITYPGQETADGERATKREALEHIRVLHDERAARPTLEDVELPTDEADREQARREAAERVPGTLVDPHTWLRGRLNKRYVVMELGPNYFAIRDTRTGLDVGTRTSREDADARASALNFE